MSSVKLKVLDVSPENLAKLLKALNSGDFNGLDIKTKWRLKDVNRILDYEITISPKYGRKKRRVKIFYL